MNNSLLFEIAWEVANRGIDSNIVGGIYTVLKSKAPVTVAEYSDRYILIGPLLSRHEVEECQAPTALRQTLKNMANHGVKFLFGKWLIESSPFVLLFDLNTDKLNEWKADLWNIAGVPSPPDDHETNLAIAFGYLVTWFFQDVYSSNLAITPHKHSYCRPLSRMALWRGFSLDPQKILEHCYCLYHPCHSSRPLSLCWRCRLL